MTRRDDEDLVLMTAARADQEQKVLVAAIAMLFCILGIEFWFAQWSWRSRG